MIEEEDELGPFDDDQTRKPARRLSLKQKKDIESQENQLMLGLRAPNQQFKQKPGIFYPNH